MNHRVQSAAGPLPQLPSILALRDLRRRIRRKTGGQLDHDTVLALLHLDPPAVLRAVRAASAPIYGARPQAWTIETIAQTLGPTLTRQALDVAAADVTGTEGLRKLWLHAITAAHGARALAQATGLMDPAEAYLAGLVHDLPRWLEYAGRRRDGSPAPGSAGDWRRHWCLPEQLTDLIETCQDIDGSATCRSQTDQATVVIAAELLAELAEFPHPDETTRDPRAADQGFALIGRGQMAAAGNLRQQVQADLAAAGLELAVSEPEHIEPDDDSDWLSNRPRTEPLERMVSALGSQRPRRYREIIKATTAAALRFLGYDRALYAKWIAASGRLAVNTPGAAAAGEHSTILVEATAQERDDVSRALSLGRPVRLDATRNEGSGLLRLIGADEAIAVPVNREFRVPTLLILDRTLSASPIGLPCESDSANSLAVLSTMLNENLLLKRRRQRAQRFALIDPLTRLYNRRMGITSLDEAIARSQRTGSPLTILMIDLDDFKGLNDTHGHVQGDHALRATAEVLRNTMRRGDTVCRYGGEEFLVVLPSTKAEKAAILAARLFTAIEARGQQLGLPITVSIGQSSLRPEDTSESCLQRADQALYASKSLGRNRFSVDADLD